MFMQAYTWKTDSKRGSSWWTFKFRLWTPFTRMNSLVLLMLPSGGRRLNQTPRLTPPPNPTILLIPKWWEEIGQGKQAWAMRLSRSIYPVLFGIGRDSKARKFQKAPYKEPSLWYNFLSLLASPCKSLITPTKQLSKTTASSVSCNEKICALVGGSTVFYRPVPPPHHLGRKEAWAHQ